MKRNGGTVTVGQRRRASYPVTFFENFRRMMNEMQEFEEKIHKAIKDEYIEKISKHEAVIGDSDNGIQITVNDSRKIMLTNGDIIIYIKNS